MTRGDYQVGSDADPECVAFNSSGELFRKGEMIVDPESRLYQKRR